MPPEEDSFNYRESLTEAYLGFVRFLEETAEIKHCSKPSPELKPLELFLGENYYFSLNRASWDFFKSVVSLVVATSCIVGGQKIIGGLASIVAIGDFVKSVMSNLHKLDYIEREIIQEILKFIIDSRDYPTTDFLVNRILNTHPENEPFIIKSKIEHLIKAGVFTKNNKDAIMFNF